MLRNVFSVYFRLRLELESFLKIFAGPSFQPETKRRKDDDRFYYFSVFRKRENQLSRSSSLLLFEMFNQKVCERERIRLRKSDILRIM